MQRVATGTKAIKLRTQKYSYCGSRRAYISRLLTVPRHPRHFSPRARCTARDLEINPISRSIQKRGNYTNRSNFGINSRELVALDNLRLRRSPALSLDQTSRAARQ